MKTITTNVQTTNQRIEELLDEMREHGQPRSNYVLEHFVVGQHDTPAVQRKQVLDELNALMFALGDMHDDMELAKIDAQEFGSLLKDATGFHANRLKIDANKANRKVRSLEIAIEGRVKECEFLLGLLDRLPKVSRDEFERQQSDYWARRLTRQFYLGQRDHGGNLDAVLQMATTAGEYKPPLPVGLNEVLQVINPNLKAVSDAENGGDLPAGNRS